jgi:hypothetical protein
MERRAALLLALAAIGIAGCGSDGSSTTGGGPPVPGGARMADVQVIENWVAALDRNDIAAAAGYFAVPSVAENGILIRIHDLRDAETFNATLPCGGKVVRAVSVGKFTTATFRLSERPGPGVCGAGVGGKAQTSFVVRDGKIKEWRRVGAGGAAGGAPTSSA